MDNTLEMQYLFVFCTKFKKKLINDQIAIDVKQLTYLKCQESSIEVIDLIIEEENTIKLIIKTNVLDSPHKIITNIKNFLAGELKKSHDVLLTKVPNLWIRDTYIQTIGIINNEAVKKFISSQKLPPTKKNNN